MPSIDLSLEYQLTLQPQLLTVEERYSLKLQKLEDENASLSSDKRNSDTLLKTSKVSLY